MVVGATIGLATRRIHSVGRTLTLSAGVGIGLAVENYSNQLRYSSNLKKIFLNITISAPYIKPAVVEVEPKALLLTHSALPLGSVWEAVSSLTSSSSPPPPKQEEKVEEAPVEAPVEEAAVEEEAAPETIVEAILESVEETVEKAIDEVEEAVADGT